MTAAFDFTLSLRVFHPHLDPQAISAALELVPERNWKAGDPRRTPVGTPQEGKYNETYCLFVIANEKDGGLAECLTRQLERLAHHETFFHDLRNTGGQAELSAFWYPRGDAGEVFAASLLNQMGRLGLDLALVVSDAPPSQ